MSATEKVFSRRVTETRDGRKGQRIYTQVPWDTRDDDVPQMDEAFPDDSDLRVVSREFRPIKVDGDDYDYCEALIQYSTKERLRIKEWWELASEGTTQPETLTWQSDSTEEEVRVPRLVVEGVYCRQVYRTYNPISMLAEAVGKVNDATFGKFPAGTLLYLGPDIRVIYQSFIGASIGGRGGITFTGLQPENTRDSRLTFTSLPDSGGSCNAYSQPRTRRLHKRPRKDAVTY